MENIIKKLDIKKFSIIALLVVLALFAFITSWSYVGAALLALAVIISFFGMSKEVYAPTGSQIKRYTFYFEGENRNTISEAIKDNFGEKSKVVEFISTGSGRLDVSVTRDKKFAILEVYHFVPHKYEPVGKPVVLDNEKVINLCSYIEKCAGKKIC